MTTAARSWLALAIAACLATPIHAQTPVSEDEIKAAFLYNFAKYVTWPAKALPPDKLRVCVVGDPAFGRRLDGIVQGESIDGRQVSRPALPGIQDIARSCNIVFVGANESSRTSEVLAAVRNEGVLTVGETEAFSARGGMITFVKDGDRVRFDINVGEAERAGLTISSRLLRLARRVTSGRDSLP